MGIRRALALWLDPDLGRDREETIAYLTSSLQRASQERDALRGALERLVSALGHEVSIGAVSARLRGAYMSAKATLGNTIFGCSLDTLNGSKDDADPPRPCKHPYPVPGPSQAATRARTKAEKLAEDWANRPSYPIEPTVAAFDDPPDTLPDTRKVN